MDKRVSIAAWRLWRSICIHFRRHETPIWQIPVFLCIIPRDFLQKKDTPVSDPTVESHEFIILPERARMRTGPEIPSAPCQSFSLPDLGSRHFEFVIARGRGEHWQGKWWFHSIIRKVCPETRASNSASRIRNHRFKGIRVFQCPSFLSKEIYRLWQQQLQISLILLHPNLFL